MCKWHQLLISGDKVTVDQAKDIILRTDQFFAGDAFGNNREWICKTLEKLGIKEIDWGYYNYPDRTVNRIANMYELSDMYKANLGHIETEYVHNCWASSSYIFGPFGWCHPDGTIYHTKNIGKWPESESVLGDFHKIATAFPYLNMQAVLMDGEEFSNEETKPDNAFIISGGEVTVTSYPDDVERVYQSIKRKHEDVMESRSFSYITEQGLPDSWFDEFAVKTRAAIKKAKDECGN